MSQSIAAPVVDLLRTPQGPRDRQLLLGDEVNVVQEADGFSKVIAAKDGYVGWVPSGSLGTAFEATHRVSVPASHLYPRPDFKSEGAIWVSFDTKLRVVSASGAFFETDNGLFIPKPHLRPLNAPFADPVAVAQMFFGVPYLWGGNSAQGIDCSGLVQVAMLAAGRVCPGDSGPQSRELGGETALDAPVQRGDLFFWKGHVALAVDAGTLIHANAGHMAVAYEGLSDAIMRIEQQGDGPVTVRRRLM